jgi:hypothetical protein
MTTSLKICAASVIIAVLSCGVASAATVIANGSFEDGTSGYPNFVPDDWTANANFLNDVGFAGVVTGAGHTGDHELQIGNYDDQPIDMLSQTLNTVAGESYKVSWYYSIAGGHDDDAFFEVLINGNDGFLGGDADVVYAGDQWSTANFTFTASGNDVLTLGAKSTQAIWVVDDVAVDPVAVAAAPLPGTLPLFATGLAAIGWVARRRKRCSETAGV